MAKGSNLFLRQYLATMPGALAASVVVLGISLIVMGVRQNPVLVTFVFYGIPALLTIAPLVLIVVLRTGLLERSAWMFLIVGVAAALVTIINFASLWLDPALVASWQQLYGDGTTGLALGMIIQLVISIIPALVYAAVFAWVCRRWKLR